MKVDIPKVKDNNDLVVGEYYWCLNKGPLVSSTIEFVGELYGEKYVGNKVWAAENQALAKWDMCGPTPEPIIKEN